MAVVVVVVVVVVADDCLSASECGTFSGNRNPHRDQGYEKCPRQGCIT